MAIRTHSVQDAGIYLTVDPFTRKVTVPVTSRVIGVVGDHQSEQVTFRMPRIIDGHDMLESPRRYVVWTNADGAMGTDPLVTAEERDDGTVLLTWTVRDKTSAAAGIVSFSLHFECDDPETGALIYSWLTETCADCKILEGVNAVVGAYAAIYIDGDTLVFADYTPVHEETAELRSGIIPTGTLNITEEGKHDVGPYAYVDVRTSGERPAVTVADGVVTAEAHGMMTMVRLEAPVITVAEDGTITATANGLSSVRQARAE